MVCPGASYVHVRCPSRVHVCTHMLAMTMMSICFERVSFLFIITFSFLCFIACVLVPTPQLTHPVVIFFMKHKRKQIPQFDYVDTDLYKLILSPQYLT